MALKGVVIDPGHGGSDGGATGNGITEKDLTLKISKYMEQRFKDLNIPVKMTRETDIDLDSNARPQKILNQFGNTSDVVVISNHINAGGGEGAEVIYALRNRDTLSSKIINELEKSSQVVRKYYQRRLPSDSSKDYYYVIRDTPNTESVIVEYGFLDNANDANRLKNNYEKYAEAVVRAVADYGGYKYVPLSSSGYYVVKKGDTLWTIARDNGLTVNELKDLNNLASNLLNIGDVLLVKKETSTPPTTNTSTYTVKKGDTLYSIARNNNISVNDLKTLNNLTSNTLSIGQVLLLSKPTSSTYIVKKGDTLYGIANMFNVTVNDLKNINNLNSNVLSIGQSLIIPNQKEKDNIDTENYIVKKGDTLYSIAKAFNTTVSEIKELNNITNNVLSINQKLLIPR